MIILNVSGNLTADPIERIVNNSTAIAFTIASNERFKTADGELKETVTYVRCTIWNRPELKKLLFKGRAINATGPLKIKYYTDKDFNQQVSIDLRVSFLQVFGKGKADTSISADTYQIEKAVSEHEEETIIKDLPF